MDLSLVHGGLAAGAALAALPVILHLFMRPKPKRVIFPALRLIRERQKRSKKKMRIKNWLLLLARMALLALMALALARPTLVAERMIGDQEVPTAIGLVFDTSLSMGYTQQDKTRLKEAQERALEILSRTPSSSVVFVVDSADPTVAPLSPDAARKRVEALTLRASNRTLNAAVGQAYTAIAEVDKPRHEVFVLTDLARSAWDMDRPAEGLDKAAKIKTGDKAGVKTYVVRLAPHDVHDVAVVEARPSSDVVTEGEPLEIKTRIRAVGQETSVVVELQLDGETKEKRTIVLKKDSEEESPFILTKVSSSPAVHQGRVRLTGLADPLKYDDERYFTFSVRPAVNVLVVSDNAVDGEFIMDAVDPPSSARAIGGVRPFRVEWVPTSDFLEKATNLSKKYRCIFLNNVRDLGEASWLKLSGFVQEGGGLVIGLGARCTPESYQSTAALQILPATIEKKGPRLEQPTTFGPAADYTHPLFNRYTKQLDDALALVPIYRHWNVTVHEGSRALLSFADKSPALIERVFKGPRTGRVLLWTTPLSRVPDLDEKGETLSWNEFPVIEWSFWYLTFQSATYLSGAADTNLTFEAGQNVILPLDPEHRAKTYSVQDPEKKTSESLSPPPTSDRIVIEAPQQLGNWVVKGQGANGTEEMLGFSVNPPAAESQFVSLEEADLNRLFGGKDKYALVDDPKNINEVVKGVRVGQELFPWLMAIILLLVCFESLLANRFYREPATQQAVAARAA